MLRRSPKPPPKVKRLDISETGSRSEADSFHGVESSVFSFDYSQSSPIKSITTGEQLTPETPDTVDLSQLSTNDDVVHGKVSDPGSQNIQTATIEEEEDGDDNNSNAGQIWSPLYLSALDASTRTNVLPHVQSWGKFVSPGPDRIVRDSIQMHFEFLLSRCEVSLDTPAVDDDAASHDSSVDVDGVQLSYGDVDKVDDLVCDFLQTNNVLAALTTYKGLLKRQKTSRQKAPTLAKLGLLSLYASSMPFQAQATTHPDEEKTRAEALYYCQQGFRAYMQSKNPIEAALCSLQAAAIQYANKQITASLKNMREGLQICLTAASSGHDYTCMALNNLGVLHHEQGDYNAAIRSLAESLLLQKKLLSSRQLQFDVAIVNMGITMSNIALVSERQRRYAAAISMLVEAKSLYESVDDGDAKSHCHTASTFLDRLVVEQNTRNQNIERSLDAVPSMLDMSRCSDATMGSEHCVTDRCERMFGNHDGIPNRFAHSSYCMQMADIDDFLLLGAVRPESTAQNRVRNTVLVWLGRPTDADIDLTLTTHATNATGLESRMSSIPVDLDGHTVVDAELCLREVHGQALQHIDNNEFDEAVQVFTTILRSHTEKFGDRHHLVGNAWHNIGMVRMYAGETKEALEAFEKSIKIKSKALGADHPETASSMLKIALLQLGAGDDAIARSTLVGIRDSMMHVLGQGHPLLAKILNDLGVVYYQGKDILNARRCIQLAYDYQRKYLDEGDSFVNKASEIALSNTLANMGFLSAKEGDAKNGLILWEEALAILRKYLVEDDPRIIELQNNVDDCAPTMEECKDLILQDTCVPDSMICGSPVATQDDTTWYYN